MWVREVSQIQAALGPTSLSSHLGHRGKHRLLGFLVVRLWGRAARARVSVPVTTSNARSSPSAGSGYMSLQVQAAHSGKPHIDDEARGVSNPESAETSRTRQS